jgi:hypothetical protein
VKPVDIIDDLGGRRFFMAMGCGIVNTVLVWFGKLDATTYRDVLLGTVGVYIVSNTYQAVKRTAGEATNAS